MIESPNELSRVLTLEYTDDITAKGRNGWFKADHITVFALLASGPVKDDKSVIMDVRPKNSGGDAPITLYLHPSDARALARVINEVAAIALGAGE